MKSSEALKQNLPKIYSEEEIKNIASLGEIFKGIRARLKSEGTSFELERRKLLDRASKSYNVTTYEERKAKTT